MTKLITAVLLAVAVPAVGADKCEDALSKYETDYEANDVKNLLKQGEQINENCVVEEAKLVCPENTMPMCQGNGGDQSELNGPFPSLTSLVSRLGEIFGYPSFFGEIPYPRSFHVCTCQTFDFGKAKKCEDGRARYLKLESQKNMDCSSQVTGYRLGLSVNLPNRKHKSIKDSSDSKEDDKADKKCTKLSDDMDKLRAKLSDDCSFSSVGENL